MTSTGKFFPFSRYINDLALIMDDTHKIVPSKFVLLKNSSIDFSTIENILSEYNNATSLEDIKYKEIRADLVKKLKASSEPNNIDDSGNELYIGGDISFLSHDVYDGMLYSEIYLHVSNEAGKTRYFINNTNQDISDPVVEQDTSFVNKDKDFSFSTVLLFYNIYKVGSSTPYVQDMPLGVFVLFDGLGAQKSQTLLVQSDELYGTGTSWSTRICSRFLCSSSLNQNTNITTSPSDYSTLTTVLSKFGEVMKEMENNISSREEDMLSIKQYLDNFKHTQNTNVPYILGDWWYVNGRPVKMVDTPQTTPDNPEGECCCVPIPSTTITNWLN